MANQATCTRVALDRLISDSRYQRPVEEGRVARIIENFDPKLLGTLELSKRKNGTYAVIDGQHRFEALKALGRKQVPALVHDDLSVKEEASLFTRTNMGRKALSPIQRFRAQVFSGDPQAVELQNVITETGFKVDFKETSAEGGTIRSVVELEVMYRASGVDHVRDVLKMIADIWFAEKSATDQNMIRGASLFLTQFGDRFDEHHAERLRRVSALTIVRRAKERSISTSYSAVSALVADELRKSTGLRGMTGRKDKPTLSKAKREELATA